MQIQRYQCGRILAYGLGAVPLQRLDNAWKPIVFASRTMTDTKSHYTQIEKETLATTWACEKFSSWNSIVFQHKVESCMESVIAVLPASTSRLQIDAQETDLICSSLSQYCTEGKPAKHKLPAVMRPYWEYRASFTHANNLL